MRKLTNKEKGITLISLVITIIVLIILATISINLILGKNGIIKRAIKGKKDYQQATNEEKIELANYSNKIDKYISNTRENENTSLSYSLDEKVAGTWVDGTTIFEKTYIIHINTDGYRAGTVNANIENLDKIVYLSGTVQTDIFCWNLNYYWNSNDNCRAYYDINNKLLCVDTGNSYPNSPCTAYITMRYTKTSE